MDNPLLRLIALFALGILLIIAGLSGTPGSMIGAIIDPANMQASGASNQLGTLTGTQP